MKIAYLIMINNNFKQFQWLINAICNDEDYFLIDIDRRSDPTYARRVKDYVGSRPNIQYLAPVPRNELARVFWKASCGRLESSSPRNTNGSIQSMSATRISRLKSLATIKARLTAALPRNFVDVIPFEKMAVLDPYDPHLSNRLALEMFGSVIDGNTAFVFKDGRYSVQRLGMVYADSRCLRVHAFESCYPLSEKLAKYTWKSRRAITSR